MIRLENLTKTFWIKGERKLVIDDLTLTLPSGSAVALLGRNGAGKSTLLEIISGTLPADGGRVLSNGTISWPVGLAASFHSDLTGAENVRFIARIYGVDTDELVYFVEQFAELGRSFHMPMRTYSSGMKSRLTFGASMGIKFDTYLVDEVTAVGDQAFKRKSQAVFAERVRAASAILVNHSMNEVRKFCNAGVVLEGGKAEYYEDLEEAIAVHEEALR
ncbi:ABC transporter ATP-binding protein [Tritonibacter scottomollicae]|uniref:Capsular polysaccharide transport system ATP-binding protein n=1 Tax=Tritonibacter scottomollicae TaxID=483013 RepID=A0A2T1A7X2_TRISK|nr:ABC transporter ATP-binding protein [Tritonibacter scottomollicae]PRZ44696.1 capsular polysaccharide transport system ATP-binding protein [Tritonibacter scottomollicae]